MPVARYFLWVGTALLVLLFIADACLPKVPVDTAIERPTPIIRIVSERKWPDRIVFDTGASMPRVVTAASPDTIDKPAADDPARARDAFAQLQTSDQVQVASQKKPEARMQRQQRIARRHVARRPSPRIASQSQYAWFGGRMWW